MESQDCFQHLLTNYKDGTLGDKLLEYVDDLRKFVEDKDWDSASLQCGTIQSCMGLAATCSIVVELEKE